MDVNGKTTKNQYDYYANGAYTGDTNNTSTEHYKFCTVCRQYDEKESCTNTSNFTANRNTYVKDSARSDGKVLLKKNTSTISKSNTYHYKYCTVCYQRTVAAEHDKQWEVTKEHAKFDISNHKNDLTGKFDYKDMGKQKFPDGTEKQSHAKFCKTCNYQYGDVKAHNTNTITIKFYNSNNSVIQTIENPDNKDNVPIPKNAVKQTTYSYCSGCGHFVSKSDKDLVTVCDDPTKHTFNGSCGELHTITDRYWSIECEATYKHCWHKGCGVENCASCQPQYKCITCSKCGILKYKVNGSTEIWCGHHESGHTTKFNAQANTGYENTQGGHFKGEYGW